MAGYDAVALAWFCGLFEGEGWVDHRPNGKGATTRGLCIEMTDRDVLDRIVAGLGVGTVRGPYGGTNKPRFHWSLRRWYEVEPLIEAMLPLMGERRRVRLQGLLDDPPGRRRMRPYKPRVKAPA